MSLWRLANPKSKPKSKSKFQIQKLWNQEELKLQFKGHETEEFSSVWGGSAFCSVQACERLDNAHQRYGA